MAVLIDDMPMRVSAFCPFPFPFMYRFTAASQTRSDWTAAADQTDMQYLWDTLLEFYGVQEYELTWLDEDTCVLDCLGHPHAVVFQRGSPPVLLTCALTIEDTRMKMEFFSLAGRALPAVHVEANADFKMAEVLDWGRALAVQQGLVTFNGPAVHVVLDGFDRPLDEDTLLWSRADWGHGAVGANLRLQRALEELKSSV